MIDAIYRAKFGTPEKPKEEPKVERPIRTAKFDRNAYQRDLMRKRRAMAKAQKENLTTPRKPSG